MTEHVNAKALAYLEGRLPGDEQASVAAHLAACAACRAEVEDLSHLADVLAAVPRALDAGLAQRRPRLWPSIWSRVAPAPGGLPAAGRASARLPNRAAFAMALVMCVIALTGLLASPFQRGALAAVSDPPLAVIQTPAAPRSSLTSAPAGEFAVPAAGSTATLALHQGQTPAPIPNP